ncbi:penicillin-binding transpeptidase domain-containing protein [Cryptosporangium aurantiacum]|uniref:Beta-lactamase n=1 Tax=Cryptosporangium aurantiacum TaxID=134849 RepID=A0A1M7RHV3_9ACTN|nr:penicillin-binding transpeptidase domain-containing protein [Cryptosporangium aurantiacum]SHN45827.1 Penicillin binding protein transpeptidase domain-containing protein [Cryptosporangium aurantiacum]
MSGFFSVSAISNLLVLAGMVATVVLAADLLRRRDRAWAAVPVTGGRRRWVLVLPLALAWVGVWLSGGVNVVWVYAVGAGLLAALLLGVRVLQAAHAARHDTDVSAPGLAILLLVVSLFHLGCQLTVRLSLIADPESGAADGVRSTVVEPALKSLGLPIAGLLVLLAAGLIVARRAGRPRPADRPRPPDRRNAGAGADAGAGARADAGVGRGREGGRGSVGQDLRAGWDRWRRAWKQRTRRNPVWSWLWVGALVTAPFLAPVIAHPGGGALTIGGVATPEFGKAVFLVVLAVVVSKYSVEAVVFRRIGLRNAVRQLRTGLRTEPWRSARTFERQTRFLLYPMALVGAVAFCSAVRSDFGSLIPVLAATLGVLWAALSIEARATPFDALTGEAPGLRTRLRAWTGTGALRYLRPYGLIAAALCALAAIVAPFTDYVSERFLIWRDPWAYRWNASCYPLPDGATPPAAAPPGTEVCQRLGVADLESERSQVAHALAAVNDGGLWGRGLSDVLVPRLPAASTDFVLAAAWNKLGGLTVLACAAAIVLLGLALIQFPAGLAPRTEPQPGSPDAGRFRGSRQQLTVAALLGTGLAALITGQFVFVFAATLGAVPHSGITAPFLSRGPQASLALFLAIGAVAVAGYAGTFRAARAAGAPTRRAGQRPVAQAGLLARLPTPPARVLIGASFPLCLVIGVLVTVVPYRAPWPDFTSLWVGYDENRRACVSEPDPSYGPDGPTTRPIDPAKCSTDLVAANRARVRLTIGDTVLASTRRSGVWRCTSGELTPDDLGGLVRVGNGPSGLLDEAYSDVVGSGATSGSSLRRRLLPGGDLPEGGLTLGLDPALQKVVNAAMRKPGPDGADPLAGGLVVMDAATGRVLAGSSVPAPPSLGPCTGSSVGSGADSPPLDERDDVEAWRKAHPAGVVDDNGAIEAREGLDCGIGQRDPDERRKCGSYDLQEPTAGETARKAAEKRVERAYVAGRPGVTDLPKVDVNRVVGRRFGLGSTFKVVVAAAYLHRPGTSATDLIAAPTTTTWDGDKPIRNFGDGPCPETKNGSITLADALAHSCNTAFVELARKVGWDAVSRMATALGLTAAPLTTDDDGRFAYAAEKPQRFADRAFGSDTRIPTNPEDGSGRGLNAIGEGQVEGTPLALAAVMATLANDGVPVRPMLVTAVTDPATGATTRVTPVRSAPALTPAQAAELRSALSGTAEYGTAKDLSADGALWVKTGTHEIRTDDECTPTVYACRTSWLVGVVESPRGPVSFAVALDAPDDTVGSARARWLVQQVIRAVEG